MGTGVVWFGVLATAPTHESRTQTHSPACHVPETPIFQETLIPQLLFRRPHCSAGVSSSHMAAGGPVSPPTGSSGRDVTTQGPAKAWTLTAAMEGFFPSPAGGWVTSAPRKMTGCWNTGGLWGKHSVSGPGAALAPWHLRGQGGGWVLTDRSSVRTHTGNDLSLIHISEPTRRGI